MSLSVPGGTQGGIGGKFGARRYTRRHWGSVLRQALHKEAAGMMVGSSQRLGRHQGFVAERGDTAAGMGHNVKPGGAHASIGCSI